MGCPKHFSLSGGMGAALLSSPSTAQNIISSVRDAVDIPVTCKIRVRENVEETLSFCKLMVESGVAAIAVHGRTAKQRPQHPNQVHLIKNISSSLSIPVIAKCVYSWFFSMYVSMRFRLHHVFSCSGESGNICTYDDIMTFKEKSGCTSVMIARAAQCDASVFRKEGKLALDDVIVAYLKYSIQYDNCFANTKYCVQSMLGSLLDTPRGKTFLETQNVEQIWLVRSSPYCRLIFLCKKLVAFTRILHSLVIFMSSLHIEKNLQFYSQHRRCEERNCMLR